MSQIKTAKSLYDRIGRKYKDNRKKASNDVTELPVVLDLVGDIKGKKLLDMGCGLGGHAKEFIKKGAEVMGYDASEEMVGMAREYCDGEGYFFQATHEKVVFGENAFDVCNASYSINYLKDPEIVFKKVFLWLKPNGIFVFSLPHPVWLLSRSENMDYSQSHKIEIRMKSYDVSIFNQYHPIDVFIQLIRKYGFTLLNLKEAMISKKCKGWPEEKYRLPSAYVFKVQKVIK